MSGKTVKILPTVLAYDRLALEEKLERYEAIVETVQLDVADSEFTTQSTLDVQTMVDQPTTLKRELHLMTAEPIEWLETCSEEAVEMVVGQIEAMGSQTEFVNEARRLGLKVGLAVDLDTNLAELEWGAAKTVDQLLVMTVRAGKEGQKLSREGLAKVRQLRQRGFEQEICVDGGVNEATIKACVKAGADVLAIGTALWQAEDIKTKLEELRRLAQL